MTIAKPAQKAFTLIELLVVISIITLLIAFILPSLAAARTSAQRLENANNLRSLQSALVLRGHDHNGWYPGVDSKGELYQYRTYERYEELFDGQYTNGKAAISPSETANKVAWTAGNASASNFSYAMPSLWNLQLILSWYNIGERSRNDAWRDDSNGETPVLTDRAIDNWTGFNWGFYIKSIHTNPEENYSDWRGNVAWNDGHVTWEDSPEVDTNIAGNQNNGDNLFRNGTDTVYRVNSLSSYTNETDAYMSTNTTFGGVASE